MKTIEEIKAEIQRLEKELQKHSIFTDEGRFNCVRITDKIKVLNWVLEKWK